MGNEQVIRADTLVDALLTAYPQAARVFINHRTACVGCILSNFHTLEDVARIYDLELRELLHELRSQLGAMPLRDATPQE